MTFCSAATAAAAVAAVTVAVIAAETAAGKENDENEDYPEAAIAVTIIEAHNNDLSPHLRFSSLMLRAVQYMGNAF